MENHMEQPSITMSLRVVDMNSVGIVLLCRYSSTRLPGKILKPLGGKPVLQRILERLSSLALPVCVATSMEESDTPIVEYCRTHSIRYFRGDLQNVAHRFLMCALEQQWQYAIRITGDSVFIDPAIVEQLITTAVAGSYDLVSNRSTKMYPIGQTVEVAKVETFKKYYSQFSTADDFEHVTQFFYAHENELGLRIHHATNPDGNQRGTSLAIDTPEDFERAQNLVKKMGDTITAATYLEISKNL